MEQAYFNQAICPWQLGTWGYVTTFMGFQCVFATKSAYILYT